MKVRPVLADTGRPVGTTASLLGAGWSFTTAIPLPEPPGGWTLPQQALALFIEAPWDQLNRPIQLSLVLVDQDEKPVYIASPTEPKHELTFQQVISVPPVAGAPNGTPGQSALVLDISAGTIWIPAPHQRLVWRISLGDVKEEIGFWVAAPAQAPTVGGISLGSFPPSSPSDA